MKSSATTVQEYLASLPADRRASLEVVRKVILKNLDKQYEETILWGMLAYVVPHKVWPSGYHVDPKKPLMMAGLASKKTTMTVYLMSVYGGAAGTNGGVGNPAEREWFEQAWAKSGKKLTMGGCCVHFKTLEHAALDVIGEAIKRTPAKKYVEQYLSGLKQTGRGADGKRVRPGKKVAKRVGKKVGKKKVAKK